MKYLNYFLFSLFIFIFQSSIGSYISIAGVIPNIMLVYVIIIAYLFGKSDGLIVGLIMGLLYDCFFGHYIGANLFLYGLIAYASGLFYEYIYKDNVAIVLFLVFIGTLFYNFGFFMLNILLYGYTNFLSYVYLKVFPEIIYNIIFCIPLYIFVFSFMQRGKYKPLN